MGTVMNRTERHTSQWIGVRALMSAAAMALLLLPARAQQPPQPQPPQPQQNPYCLRLETQLQTFDRSANDTSRAMCDELLVMQMLSRGSGRPTE